MEPTVTTTGTTKRPFLFRCLRLLFLILTLIHQLYGALYRALGKALSKKYQNFKIMKETSDLLEIEKSGDNIVES